MKVLQVGPNPANSKGGMASVIDVIRDDEQLNKDFYIDVYGSCVQGNIAKRFLFSIYSYLRFCLTMQDYDIYHIHVAGNGSTFRKGYYLHRAKKWGKKVILHIHGNDYMGFYNGLSDKLKARVKAIFHEADMVIALSRGWKNSFDEAFGLSTCVVIENCVDTQQYAGSITDPAKNQNAFISLGILGKRKGTYDLIEAVDIAKEAAPDIMVYIAGNGEVEQAQKMVEERHLSRYIDIVGWADFEKKLGLLRKVSTVVLPSYHEGLPMAVLEGMACGKAIISTTVGAIPEVVGEENGILIRPGDVQALADALVECAANTERIQKMSACNMEKIEQQFSMRNMREKLSACYNSLRS